MKIQYCHRNTGVRVNRLLRTEVGYTHVKQLRGNAWEAGVLDIVSFGHLPLVRFVENIGVEHDQAER